MERVHEFVEDFGAQANKYVYISQFIRFARMSSHAGDLNTRNKVLTTSFLTQFINFERRPQNFIGGILTQCLNIMSKRRTSPARPFGI